MKTMLVVFIVCFIISLRLTMFGLYILANPNTNFFDKDIKLSRLTLAYLYDMIDITTWAMQSRIDSINAKAKE